MRRLIGRSAKRRSQVQVRTQNIGPSKKVHELLSVDVQPTLGKLHLLSVGLKSDTTMRVIKSRWHRTQYSLGRAPPRYMSDGEIRSPCYVYAFHPLLQVPNALDAYSNLQECLVPFHSGAWSVCMYPLSTVGEGLVHSYAPNNNCGPTYLIPPRHSIATVTSAQKGRTIMMRSVTSITSQRLSLAPSLVFCRGHALFANGTISNEER